MKLVPFLDAAEALVEVCHEIEMEEGNLSQALLARFAESEAHLATSIDRRKAFMSQLKSMKEHAKNEKRNIDKALKRLEEIEKELKAITLHVMKENPYVRFRDSKGQSMSVSKAKAALKLDLGQAVHISHAIDLDEKDTIDTKFIETVTLYALNTSAIRMALEDGERLPWARLETTEYVRGL